jgi:hypothetical protein
MDVLYVGWEISLEPRGDSDPASGEWGFESNQVQDWWEPTTRPPRVITKD